MSAVTASISVSIPKALSDTLERVARAEARSKSYYVAKGLEAILRERLEDLEDYEEARQAYEEFVASGEEAVPFEDMKKELGL